MSRASEKAGYQADRELIRVQASRRRDGRLTLRVDLVGYTDRHLASMTTAHPIVDRITRELNRAAAQAMAISAQKQKR